MGVKIIKKLNKGESYNIFKGMLTLALGSSAARVVGLASIPIVTRIYSPDDFGILALFTALVSILVPFGTLKYSIALPLPKTDAIAINIVVLGLLLIASFSVIVGLTLLFFGENILSFFNAAELAQWWWLIVLAVAGSACYELFSLWSTRKRKYKIIAKTQLTQSIIGNVAKVALGLMLLKPFGLIFGQFLAQTAGIGSHIKGSLQDFKLNYSSVSLQRIKLVATYYRQFAYFRLPSQFLLSISSQAPILMMAALFSSEATGQLSLAMMALALPTGLIASAMGKAFYAEIASVGKRDLAKVKRLTIDVQKKLFIIGIPITAIAIVLAEPLFALVFGPEWSVAGRYAAVLAPFILMQFTSNPLIQVLNIVGSQLTFLLINIIRLAGLLILFLMLKIYLDVSPQVFVIIISAYLTIYYFIMTVSIISMVNSSVRKKVGI